jgi:putative intracellular protease/amidase
MGGKTVAVVVTSHSRMGDSGKPTGYWLEELAVPYFALIDEGVRVLLASPGGGEAPVDPRSVERARTAEESTGPGWFTRWNQDGDALAVAAATSTTASLDPTTLDAVFVAGGHGAMWDLADDPALGRLIGHLAAEGKLVGAVCHGAAAFCGATDEHGEPTVRNRKITCYSDAEEEALGLTDVVPFPLETRLRGLGADVAVGPRGTSFTMEDGNLVTGQNPTSSGATAALFVAALNGD